MKNIKYYILLLLLCLIPSFVNASNYKVKDYYISVIVDENRQYQYSENINLIFEQSDVLVTKELDISTKDIKVNKDILTETKDTKLIKINSKNASSDTYTLSYSIQEKDYDQDIYEINISNTYNSTLNNINFYITLPEDYNKNNLDFYINNKRVKNIEYEIKNGVIEGTLDKLSEDETLTIKVDYTKVYFTTTTAIATIVPIILTLISGLLWYIFGRDLKYKPSKNYDLPKDMSPLEIGLLSNGKAKEKDAFALLLYLANNGYVTIEETSNNNFVIKKTKNYDGKKYSVSIFFKSLFKKNAGITLTDYINVIQERKNDSRKLELEKEISSSELNRKFKRAVNMTLPIINDAEERDKYFEKTSDRKKMYLIIILATNLLLLTSVPFIEINKLFLLPISVVFSIITLYLLMSFVEEKDFKITRKKLITLMLLSMLILVLMLTPAFRRNRIYIITFLICLVCIGLILFFYKYMPKRTIYGTKQYAKLEGFKNFILSRNMNDFKILLSKQSNYFYDVLPYSYCININEEVFQIMKELKIQEPSWLKLKDDFTLQKLNNSLERLYKVLTTKNEE